jgi:hypothetical protein
MRIYQFPCLGFDSRAYRCQRQYDSFSTREQPKALPQRLIQDDVCAFRLNQSQSLGRFLLDSFAEFGRNIIGM